MRLVLNYPKGQNHDHEALQSDCGTGRAAAGVDNLSAVADETNYSQCDPYCIAFLEVDDDWYAVAVDHAGRYLGLSRMTNQAVGRLLADSDMAPLMPGQPQMAILRG